MGIVGLDRRRRIPGGIGLLPDDTRRADRRREPLDTDTDWIGLETTAARREIVQALLGEIDDDPFPQRIGQEIEARQHDGTPDARQPGIDPPVGRHELRKAEIVDARHVEQRILAMRRVIPDLANGALI
jgi:hypothetical protein